MRSSLSLALLVTLSLLAGGCRAAVLTQSEERDANQALAALSEAHIPAKKHPIGKGQFEVTVPQASLDEAIEALARVGLPERSEPGLAELFAEPGLVPSSLEEQVRYHRALSAELARSLRSFEGVREARVHLALSTDPGSRRRGAPPPPPPSASVLLRVEAEELPRLRGLSHELQALIAGAVPGLDLAQVSLVYARLPPRRKAPSPARPALPSGALAGIGGVAAAAGVGVLGVWLLRTPRRQRREDDAVV